MSTKAVLARFGLAKAIPYALCRAIQRLILLDITHVMIADAKSRSTPRCFANAEYREISADEVREFAKDKTNDLDASAAYRLELGYDFCFAGLVNGQLAGYCWIATDSIEARNNRSNDNPASGVPISFPADHCFRYKGFTHPDFRGHRIYPQISAAAGQAMLERGIRYTISTAEAVNFGALKSSYRCGYERLGYCMLMGWGDQVKTFTPDLSDREIYLGPEATVLDRRDLARNDLNNRIGSNTVNTDTAALTPTREGLVPSHVPAQ